MDEHSLLFNEYNQKYKPESFPFSEKNNSSVFILPHIKAIQTKVKDVLKSEHISPKIMLTELQNDSLNSPKTLAWRIAKNDQGKLIVSIVNTGHSTKSFSLISSETNSRLKITNLLTGQSEKSIMTIGKRKTLFLEIITDNNNATTTVLRNK